MNGDESGDAFFRPFHFPTTTPFIGRLSARFRSAWFGVAARWAMTDLLGQLSRFAGLISERLVALDRSQVAQTHDLGELTTQVARMNQLLGEIDARLARLEASTPPEKGD
jgi:hypothetical protein